MNIKQKILDLKGEQRQLVDKMSRLLEQGTPGEEYTEAEKAFDTIDAQIKALESQLERESRIGTVPETDKALAADMTPSAYSAGMLKGLTHDTVKALAAGIRKTMTEGTAADGGYTVPADVVARVYELIETEDSLLDEITNTPVTTNSGTRTYKARAQLTGFSVVAEAGKIGAAQQPTFGVISYTIVKRAGYLPVTNELLADSDEDIASLVIRWLADEARVTINNNVVAKVQTLTPTEITGLDGILTVLTTGLGAALRRISTIHTNDSGLLYLATLKDKNDRPLLTESITTPGQMRLAVGAESVPIKVWDNATLPNGDNDEIPFIIGSLKEAVQRFDRQSITISRLTEATLGQINLAEQDMTAFRAIMRDDYQLRDSGAIRYCLYSEPEETETAETTETTETDPPTEGVAG